MRLTPVLFTVKLLKFPVPLGITTEPVKVTPLILALLAKLLVIVVAKLGSLLKADANSFRVSSVDGAELTRLDTSVLTNCVVAI